MGTKQLDKRITPEAGGLFVYICYFSDKITTFCRIFSYKTAFIYTAPI